MNKSIIAQNARIVMGVDVHKVKHSITAADGEGKVLKYAQIDASAAAWQSWLKKFPGCDVTVVYEAGPDGYALHDRVSGLGHKVVVTAPQSHIGPKTDKRDSIALARDYLAGRVRAVTVPDRPKRVRRQVLRARDTLVAERTRWLNRISSMKRFHGDDGDDGSGYLEYVEGTFREVIATIAAKIKELDRCLRVIAREKEYRDTVSKLIDIKGVGMLTALEVTLGVADMKAFPTSGRFASYTGLCPGEFSTGESRRLGHITRRGPGRIRGILVQCAWAAVRSDAETKERYQKLAARVGARRAIVAIARRLAVKMWWALRPPGEEDGTKKQCA